MKHHGNTSDFAAMRNRELLRAYRSVLAAKPFFNISTDFSEVVHSPCSRFWVSEERATAVVSDMLRGIPVLASMRPSKQELFREVFRRVVVALIADPSTDTPLCDVVFLVINSPAPQFYMSPRHAREIIYRVKQGKVPR